MTQKDKDLQLIDELQSFILRAGVNVTLPAGKVIPNPALKFLSWMITYKEIEFPDFNVSTAIAADEKRQS